MATLKYDDIFNLFLGSIRDYEFCNLNEVARNECLVEWLHASLANPYISRLFTILDFDDTTQIITYELEKPSNKIKIDTDFVISIFAKQMVFQWLSPKVNNTVNLSQAFLSNSDSKFYAQANHISSTLSVCENADLEVRRMIRDRGYINNSYLD